MSALLKSIFFEKPEKQNLLTLCIFQLNIAIAIFNLKTKIVSEYDHLLHIAIIY